MRADGCVPLIVETWRFQTKQEPRQRFVHRCAGRVWSPLFVEVGCRNIGVARVRGTGGGLVCRRSVGVDAFRVDVDVIGRCRVLRALGPLRGRPSVAAHCRSLRVPCGHPEDGRQERCENTDGHRMQYGWTSDAPARSGRQVGCSCSYRQVPTGDKAWSLFDGAERDLFQEPWARPVREIVPRGGVVLPSGNRSIPGRAGGPRSGERVSRVSTLSW